MKMIRKNQTYWLNFSWVILSPTLYLIKEQFEGFDGLFFLTLLYLSALYGAYIYKPENIKKYSYKILMLVIFIVPSIFLAMLSQLRSYFYKGDISVQKTPSFISRLFGLENGEIFYAFLSITLFFVAFLPFIFFIETMEYLIGWMIQGVIYSFLMFILQIGVDGTNNFKKNKQ